MVERAVASQHEDACINIDCCDLPLAWITKNDLRLFSDINHDYEGVFCVIFRGMGLELGDDLALIGVHDHRVNNVLLAD